MTLKFSSPLSDTLAGATSMLDWSTKIKTALGTSLRVRCFRDANAAATDPFTTGTEFLNTGTSGGITLSGARIASIGKTVNVTTNLAADLSTGASILRIEGNGHWVQGTLGLTGSGADFTMTASPTGSNGIAADVSVLPPGNRSSGTGYAAPALDVDAPAYVIVETGADVNSVTELGRIPFDTRIKDWIFEDKEIAANMGDVRVTQSSVSLIYNDIEIGAMLLTTDAQAGTVAGKPVHRVLCNYKPTAANWPGYPAYPGYQQGTRTSFGATRPYGISNTFPGPHRFRIMTADNRQVGVIDMDRDHSLINNAQLSEVQTLSKPIRPNLNCAQMVVWESQPAKMNSYAKKWLAGVDKALFMRDTQMKRNDAVNPINLFITSYNQTNGASHWHAVPKWGMAGAKAAIDSEISARIANDPYLWGNTGNGLNTPAWASFYGVASGDMVTGMNYGVETAFGYGYEPGSISCHDMYSGPGGIRIDRGAVPAPIMTHITDPNWTRMRDGTSISELMTHWRKAYFNHAIHHFTDVKTFASIPVSEVLNNQWSHYQVYYNGSVFAAPGSAKSIPQFVYHPDSEYTTHIHNGAFVDTNGRMPWNGFSVDWFHNYSAHGLAAAVYNDPALAVSAKFRYLASILCQFNYMTPDLMSTSHFGIRSLAWVWLQNAFMWKLASDHPLGISRRDVEARIEAELVAIYKNVYIPLRVKNDQTMKFRVLRNLGMMCQKNDTTWAPSSWALHYYMAHTLQIWKQYGLFDVMWNRSDACRKALQVQIDMLDKGCIDYYLDTDGYYSGSTYGNDPNLWIGDRTTGLDSVEVPTSWADWKNRGAYPRANLTQDLVHNADGSLRNPDIAEWSRMQWPFIRRDYFADIPCARDVAACCTKVDGWQQALATNIANLKASGATAYTLMATDGSVHPGVGRPLPPTTLGVAP